MMREVSKNEFFEPINRDRLDLHPSIINGTHPYISEYRWRTNPHKRPYGKVVGRIECGLEVNSYFVSDAA